MKRKDGYVLDTTYPEFFYKEMQPIWLNTVVNFLGFKAPNLQQKFSYLELACATGINLLISALNHPQAQFVGVDFNQQHIKQAQQSAKKLGLENIEFIHADFSEFLAEDTQKFDFIVNHGTFTWISHAHQQQILDIIDHSLNESGLCYLHYMCYPGSKDLIPLQKLLNLVDEQYDESSTANIEAGKQLFYNLNAAGAFVNETKIDAVLNTLNNHNADLAHEFLTDHWKPLFSVDLHKRVYEKTKMTYLGSAHPCENLESISIPANMQQMIRETQQPALREYLKDLARDAKQRVDIFQKKPIHLNKDDHFKAISEIKFKLLSPQTLVNLEVFNTPIGPIKSNPNVLKALCETMGDGQLSFNALLNLTVFNRNPLFIIETLFLLMQEQHIHPVSEQILKLTQSQTLHFQQWIEDVGINLKLVPQCATAMYTV